MKSSPECLLIQNMNLTPDMTFKGHTSKHKFCKEKKKKNICYPIAFAALLCKLFLIAWNAHGIIVTWYEALVSDWLLANHAHEAFLMPLFALVFKLLHACKNKKRNAMRSYSYVNLLSSYLPFNRGGISSIQKQIG